MRSVVSFYGIVQDQIRFWHYRLDWRTHLSLQVIIPQRSTCCVGSNPNTKWLLSLKCFVFHTNMNSPNCLPLISTFSVRSRSSSHLHKLFHFSFLLFYLLLPSKSLIEHKSSVTLILTQITSFNLTPTPHLHFDYSSSTSPVFLKQPQLSHQMSCFFSSPEI